MGEPAREQPESPVPAVKPKVIYTMGSGRSGSTILGVSLGNCDGVFFAGELDRWLSSRGRPVLGGSERTRFWREVGERVKAPEDLMNVEARDRFERARGLLRGAGPSGLRGRYRRVTGEILQAIADVAGASHVVDTSHFALRARELGRVEEIDLYLIFLSRDPRTMLASFTRTLGPNDRAKRLRLILKTNVDLWVAHLLAILVFLRQPAERRLFLRYEDFIADPERVLREILDFAGSSAELPDLSSLSTGLAIGGNALLRSDVVALKGDTRRPTRGSYLTALLQAPLTAAMDRLRPAVSQTPGGSGR
jgi:Sulfotransferase family